MRGYGEVVDALHELTAKLGKAGANLTVEAPGRTPLRIGSRPGEAQVVIKQERCVRDLERGDLLAVAEAYLRGDIDIEGDFLEAVKVTDILLPGPSRRQRLRHTLDLALRDRRKLQRASVAFHYDRPPDFFLPWFERWRSYSHGLYLTDRDAPSEAQERKLAAAFDALGLAPGMRVFDMGCGWGSFLEYAGLRGVHVHGITISVEQHRFVERLIREKQLPCSVQRVDFLDFETSDPFDGAVFMGTLEHFNDYGYAAGFLRRSLRPGARMWADFCSAHTGHQVGGFLGRHIFPGTARYVDLPELVHVLAREGFNIHHLQDDTRSYALSCRDWADAQEREFKGLVERFGEAPVRAFRVFLRASQHFLQTNQVQAYHLVAGSMPRSV